MRTHTTHSSMLSLSFLSMFGASIGLLAILLETCSTHRTHTQSAAVCFLNSCCFTIAVDTTIDDDTVADCCCRNKIIKYLLEWNWVIGGPWSKRYTFTHTHTTSTHTIARCCVYDRCIIYIRKIFVCPLK